MSLHQYVSFSKDSIVTVNSDSLTDLKKAAAGAPLRRARYCLHRGHDDAVQEMVIAFCRDSYVRPHRHINKTESFHIIEGELIVLFYDDDGRIIRSVRMSAGKNGKVFLYRLAESLWHSVMPLSEYVIIHESTTGPFEKEKVLFPSWAPEETDRNAVRQFMQKVERWIDGNKA